jgi:hypothetical protein
MRQYPEWLVKGDAPNPQDGRLVSVRNTCSFSFNPYNYNFFLEMPTGGEALTDNDVQTFINQVDLISRIVNDYLGLDTFTRISFRAWYLFSFDSLSESKNWLSHLGYFSISDKLITAFRGEIEAATMAILLTSTDRKYRLSFNSVERQAQLNLGEEILTVRASTLSKDQDKFLRQQMQAKRRMHLNPEFAAMFDIDAFQEDPISIDPRDFIETSIDQYSERLTSAAGGK